MKKLCMYALAPAIALALSATAPATAQEAAVVDNGPPNGPPNGEGRRHKDPVKATVHVKKDRYVIERIFKLKGVLVLSYGIITPDGAAESDVVVVQKNVDQVVNHNHGIDFPVAQPLNLDATISGSMNGNLGIIQLNQDAGNMVNQGNVASVSVTASETAFTDANAAATQYNAGNLSRTTVPFIAPPPEVFTKEALIENSITTNSGVIHVNQNTGDMNNQLNITSAGFGEGSVAALADSELGQFNTGNRVVDVNTFKRDRIIGSVNGNTGIVNVNQSSGKFNNQGTMVSFAGSAGIGLPGVPLTNQ